MYSLKVSFATARRILTQLRHDPRTVALIFVVPCVLLGLLRWLYDDNMVVFNQIAPALLGIFPFVIMFIVTSITTLRERTSGTMERLMTTPMPKFSLVLGYMLAFGLLAIIQALLAGSLLLFGLGLDVQGSPVFLLVMALADSLLGTALGIFVSAFARTEFQAVQFMPALIFPQVLIGGLLLPLDQMPHVLEIAAYCLPLTYAIDALNEVVKFEGVTAHGWRDLIVVLTFMIGAVILASLTLRRRTK